MSNRNRSLLSIGLLALLVVTSGCLGGNAGTETSTRTPTETVTQEPVKTGDLPHDLTLRNFGNETTSMHVSVTFDETGEEIFSKEVTLDPGEREIFELSFVDAGNYTVEATVAGSSFEYEWVLDYVPPSYELVVTTRGANEDVTFLESSA